MIRRFIETSLRLRALVIAAAVVVLVVGIEVEDLLKPYLAFARLQPVEAP